GHRDPEIAALYDRLVAEFAAIPGVKSVTLSKVPLLGRGTSAGAVTVSGGQSKSSRILPIGPGFFSTMEIPVLRGRAIDGRDRPGAPYAAVVNLEFARVFFGNEDPLGRHVISSSCRTCDIQIVGVVANTLYGRLKASPFTPAGPPPILFLSL